MENGTKGMTEEERLALAAKLDKELDEFIEKLPKRQAHSGEPIENWLEEFETHPFFMKKSPEPGEELHPLYQGLQQLKYDPNENTPEELALSYKEDGNFNFKHKNYRLAVLAYTEGIKQKCGNKEIEATLHNNRSAANWFIKNYRSCLNDCEKALQYKPDYDKPMFRAAQACYEIARYDSCLAHCDAYLEMHPSHQDAMRLRQSAINAAKTVLRDQRKREALRRKETANEEILLKEIQRRGIQMEQRKGSLDLETLEPQFPQLVGRRVHLNERSELIWPVVFLYPEYQSMDFIQEFNENETLELQIGTVFESLPEWDKKKVYRANNLNVYYENATKNAVFKVDRSRKLGEILQSDSLMVRGGTPSFIILVKDSRAEKSFLEKY